MLVPDRALFVARLDGVIAGSAQLVRPTRNNEAQAHSAQLTTSFVAPSFASFRCILIRVKNALKW